MDFSSGSTGKKHSGGGETQKFVGVSDERAEGRWCGGR